MAKFDIRPDIDAAAERLSNTVGSKREINKLPEVLWEGETVDMLATGIYGKGNGLIAMTSMRLIFLKHGVMSQQIEDFPYSKISSVQWQGGMIFGTLTVYASGNKAEIKQIPKENGKALADKLRMHLAQGSTPGAASAPASAVPGQDIGSRLATLDQLRAAGAITDAEYQDRRAKILDSL
ncbi:PH domain-containing protein [Streptomyces antimycoticus]|uniref:PH domain-containing protein n=1 Tax=Streptomyces antimycoticus TaxID=68175 RepID=UPI00256FC7A0|nr:PH domain-containing protein [Streptomyces antimycoticus]WJD99760.1 PH domain-containing protein [Streptomyces antimycoticus]